MRSKPAAAVGLFLLAAPLVLAVDRIEPGLNLRIESGAGVDYRAAPNVTFYAPAGAAISAFVPAGALKADWSGFVTVDVRSYFTFHASFNGDFDLSINGQQVISTNLPSAGTASSTRVRLNKGTNAFAVLFRHLGGGDAFVRLEWAERGGLPFPMPDTVFSRPARVEVERMELLRRGRELFAEYRCGHCHEAGREGGMAELEMDAPAFSEIGGRRRVDWMAEKILSPDRHREDARMPRLFAGGDAEEQARLASEFLGSLIGGTPDRAKKGEAAAGAEVFRQLNCGGCHLAPGEEGPVKGRFALNIAGFKEGALRSFLLEPGRWYRWIRMPNFHLTGEEADHLAAYLEGHLGGEMEKEIVELLDPVRVEKGREIVSRSGCLNCHAVDLENQHRGKSLADISAAGLERGCLSSAREDAAPLFAFRNGEREALRGFLRHGVMSLSNRDTREFAERQVLRLNCSGCHGAKEGFPGLSLLGAKLNADWSARFIGGKVEERPRPWLEMRMPSFPAYADELANGLALIDGVGPAPAALEPVDEELADVGRKLVSAVGGFSCVACHGAGDMPPQVFETPGINLALVHARLREGYFRHWLLNPAKLDPGTKMPVYFDEEGRSPLFEILDGDGMGQIAAIWEYLKLGRQMPPPQ